MGHPEAIGALVSGYVDECVAAAVAAFERDLAAVQRSLAVRDAELSDALDESARRGVDVSNLTQSVARLEAALVEARARIAELEKPPVVVEPAPVVFDVVEGQPIQHVLDAKPEGATIFLGPGSWRLSKKLAPKARQRLVGPVGGFAEFRGDVVLSSWEQVGTVWVHTGGLPPAYVDNGQCEVNAGSGANPCKQREQVWLDGKHLTRVMSVAEVGPDSFYQDFATGRTHIGVDPTGRVVEMSSTREAINSSVDGVHLERIKVRRFASAAQLGAVVVQGDDWNVGYCDFSENHAIGIHLTTAHRARIHHNDIHHNGQLGMSNHRSNDTVLEDNVVRDNNTDGFWRADWESGGIKVTYSNRAVLRNNTVENNEGVGVWFDIDNKDVECYGNTITNNYGDGVRYEISYAGDIHHNTISGNGFRYAKSGGRGADYSLFATGGINVNTSIDVKVHHNTLGPNQNGIGAQKRNRGISSTYGTAWDLQNLDVHDNTVELTSGSLSGEGVSGIGTLQQADATPYYDARKNNRFHNNAYKVFGSGVRKFAWKGGYHTFANAQAAGTEAGSTLTII